MKNTIKIEFDYGDSELIVNISECFLTNKEITALVTMLWELSWNTEADFDATNHKSQQWFIFTLPYDPETSLESLAEKLQEKVQQLFPDKFVNIN